MIRMKSVTIDNWFARRMNSHSFYSCVGGRYPIANDEVVGHEEHDLAKLPFGIFSGNELPPPW